VKRGFALCLMVLAWALAAPASAETLRGVVIVVIDGDTVLFKPDHTDPSGRAFLKIRLADIDAPEHDQPYGDAATRALSGLVLNQRVEVEIVATDVYGRTIGRIRMGGDEFGADLVRRGFAWSATRSWHASGLKAAQRQARLARRGLWRDAAPVPPWLWRRTHSASGL
jgi:micrococcal nuclease